MSSESISFRVPRSMAGELRLAAKQGGVDLSEYLRGAAVGRMTGTEIGALQDDVAELKDEMESLRNDLRRAVRLLLMAGGEPLAKDDADRLSRKVFSGNQDQDQEGTEARFG